MCRSKSNSPCVSWARHRISHCLWTSTPRRLTFSMAGSGRMWRCLVRCCPRYQDSAQHRNISAAVPSRCTKGSKNREKARIRVAKMHQRDENAVVNLFVEGLRILAEGRSVIVCGDTVRLERKPKHMSAKQETSLETCGHVA